MNQTTNQEERMRDLERRLLLQKIDIVSCTHPQVEVLVRFDKEQREAVLRRLRPYGEIADMHDWSRYLTVRAMPTDAECLVNDFYSGKTSLTSLVLGLEIEDYSLVAAQMRRY